MENTANFAELSKTHHIKPKIPNRYNSFVKLNPEKKEKINQFLRANGVTDAIMYNWIYERTKPSPVHEILFDKIAKKLSLIEE